MCSLDLEGYKYTITFKQSLPLVLIKEFSPKIRTIILWQIFFTSLSDLQIVMVGTKSNVRLDLRLERTEKG